MDHMTRNAVRSLMDAREAASFDRLESDLDYQKVCKEQENSEEWVEALYRQRFEKSERIAVRRHYEGEVHKTNYKIQEAYIQGLRDCFFLIGFLSGNEVRI